MNATFEYDTTYPGPAFPIIEFTLIGRGTGDQELVTGYIDTGADGSLIPLDILQNIGARLVHNTWARNVSGQRYMVDMYAVNIQIGSHMIYGIDVVANKQTREVIVGRDVLNNLIVNLNGLAELAEITD